MDCLANDEVMVVVMPYSWLSSCEGSCTGRPLASTGSSHPTAFWLAPIGGVCLPVSVTFGRDLGADNEASCCLRRSRRIVGILLF